MIAGTGSVRDVLTIKYGLDADNRPIFEGETLYMGGRSWSEQIKDENETVCVDCNETDYFGTFRVAVTRWCLFGVEIYRRTDAVNFRCLECLHDHDPVTYPHANLDDAFGGDK